jgi:hypothetical protein
MGGGPFLVFLRARGVDRGKGRFWCSPWVGRALFSVLDYNVMGGGGQEKCLVDVRSSLFIIPRVEGLVEWRHEAFGDRSTACLSLADDQSKTAAREKTRAGGETLAGNGCKDRYSRSYSVVCGDDHLVGGELLADGSSGGRLGEAFVENHLLPRRDDVGVAYPRLGFDFVGMDWLYRRRVALSLAQFQAERAAVVAGVDSISSGVGRDGR